MLLKVVGGAGSPKWMGPVPRDDPMQILATVCYWNLDRGLRPWCLGVIVVVTIFETYCNYSPWVNSLSIEEGGITDLYYWSATFYPGYWVTRAPFDRREFYRDWWSCFSCLNYRSNCFLLFLSGDSCVFDTAFVGWGWLLSGGWV